MESIVTFIGKMGLTHMNSPWATHSLHGPFEASFLGIVSIPMPRDFISLRWNVTLVPAEVISLV